MGWHRKKDTDLGVYSAAIKITIEGTEASCIDYNEKNSILAIGCLNGQIICYTINQ